MPCKSIKAIITVLPELMLQQAHEEVYRVYLTDTLRLIGHIEQRYVDLIHPERVDNRTGDEIAQDVIASAGLRFE